MTAVLATAALAAAQELTDMSLGQRITAELRSIVVEHREAVREALLDFKLKLEQIEENKTELIAQFLEERQNRMEQIRTEIENLRQQYLAGNITKEEYTAALKALQTELKALAKSSEKLGQRMQELVKEVKEAVKEKVERLREINREFGQRVAEEAKKLGDMAREEAGNQGTDNDRGRGQGNPHRDNSTETNNADNSNRGQNNTADERPGNPHHGNSTDTDRGRRGQNNSSDDRPGHQHQDNAANTENNRDRERGRGRQ